jgi:hypothetical protein
MITEKQIMDELSGLDPGRWDEVLDFIAFLKRRKRSDKELARPRHLTARELSQSEIVGMWADREDIGDSVSFARKLRHTAEHRWSTADDSA